MHLTKTQRARLHGLTDEWREEEDGWKAGVVFWRLECKGLCEMQERRIAGGDVLTGPGSWGVYRWFTRRTDAGRKALDQQVGKTDV